LFSRLLQDTAFDLEGTKQTYIIEYSCTFIIGVTNGLSQGGKAYLKGPTGHRRGTLAKTQKKIKKW